MERRERQAVVLRFVEVLDKEESWRRETHIPKCNELKPHIKLEEARTALEEADRFNDEFKKLFRIGAGV